MGRFARWVKSAGVLRRVLWGMRELRPVFRLGGRVFVLRHADVIDALERQDELSVSGVYARRMHQTSGDFFLGMDDGPQYRREEALTRAAVHAGDLDRIRDFVRRRAEAIVRDKQLTGRIDVVTDLARAVPLELLSDFFGVPGPDVATLDGWMRGLFHYLFFDPDDTERVRTRALKAGGELRDYMVDLIAERRALGAPDDTMLDRMIRSHLADPAGSLDDDGIRRNIGGLIIGAVDTTAKATVLALQSLLARPAALRGARDAARAGDRDLLLRYLFEALRFNPFNPVMFRVPPEATTVGAGGARVKADEQVWLSPLLAMFDPRAFEQPGEFRLDRPLSSYILFGFGLHTCFGSLINRVTLPELVAPLLADDVFRPLRGAAGRIVWDRSDQFPDHWACQLGRAETA